MTFLDIKNLHLNIGEFQLKEISFSINKGDYLAIVGPTGAGKSILIESIIGFHTPHKGKIILDKKDITHEKPYKRNISIVYQDYALMPHMTVFRNIAYGLKRRIKDKDRLKMEVGIMAEKLGINHLLNRKPETLSGGEQQRVALARALVVKPELLLMDEPFSSLDPQMRRESRALVRHVIESEGSTVIHVTHDFHDAWAMANKAAVFNKGRMLQFGPFESVFNAPSCQFSADFLGVIILDGIVAGSSNGLTQVDIGSTKLYSVDRSKSGSTVRIAVRPENIMIAKDKPENISALNIIKTTLEGISREENLISLSLRLGDFSFNSLMTRNAFEEMKLGIGDTVFGLIKSTHVRIV